MNMFEKLCKDVIINVLWPFLDHDSQFMMCNMNEFFKNLGMTNVELTLPKIEGLCDDCDDCDDRVDMYNCCGKTHDYNSCTFCTTLERDAYATHLESMIHAIELMKPYTRSLKSECLQEMDTRIQDLFRGVKPMKLVSLDCSKTDISFLRKHCADDTLKILICSHFMKDTDIVNLTNLTMLDCVQSSEITDDTLQRNSKSLTSLICGLGITNKGISHLHKLVKLDLIYGSEITGKDCDEVRSLEHLVLGMFNESILKNMINGLKNSLKVLDCSRNYNVNYLDILELRKLECLMCGNSSGKLLQKIDDICMHLPMLKTVYVCRIPKNKTIQINNRTVRIIHTLGEGKRLNFN